ncbi:unnamed protein product [Angiostrongylus costaricensis]|uniref:Dimer_Tnp_hAT domain-containing protein n=1 Tax=Angiostrongylus costaricensis TaxID=334426 RepID=A0A0R3PAA4_ANGCS|nr:unnamed protein product [Angiostrongylus costaricensis]
MSSHQGTLQPLEHRCGLPDNYDSLPDYAQAELNDLWSTWVPDTPCMKELEIQHDIFNLVKAFSNKLERKKQNENTSGRLYVVPAATTPDDYDDDYVVQNSEPFWNVIETKAEAKRNPQSRPTRFDEVT